MYKLRKATVGDSELSFDIRKNALGKYVEQTWGWDEKWQWEYHLEDFNPGILQIIESDGITVGTLELIVKKDFMTVSGIYIIDKFQSQGIGKDIMKSIISNAGKENKAVKLQVLKVNRRAKDFYLKLGFKENGETEFHYQMIYNSINK